VLNRGTFAPVGCVEALRLRGGSVLENAGSFVDGLPSLSADGTTVAFYSGAKGNGSSTLPILSADGRRVVFASESTNLDGRQRRRPRHLRQGAGATTL
jgi:Tol biopolymer transport system component